MFIYPKHRAVLLGELQQLEKEGSLSEDQVIDTIMKVSNSQLIHPVVIDILIASLERKGSPNNLVSELILILEKMEEILETR